MCVSTRIGWIDCLRGFGIFLIVYHHVLDKVFAYNSDINSFIEMFFTPLFFFISGFFAYRQTIEMEEVKYRVKREFLRIFLPGIIVGILHTLLSDRTFEEFISRNGHAGYWFTQTLFEIYLIYLLFLYLLTKNQCRNYTKSVVIAIIAIYVTYLLLLRFFWVQILFYIPYFLIGVLVKRHFTRFQQILTNKIIILTITLIFVTLCILKSICNLNQYIIVTEVVRSLCAILPITILTSLFHLLRNQLSTQSRVGHLFCYVGRQTLAIYLFHYFFLDIIRLFNVKQLKNVIENSCLSELIIVSFLAIIITFACLTVEKLLQAFPVIHGLLLGFDIKKKQ